MSKLSVAVNTASKVRANYIQDRDGNPEHRPEEWAEVLAASIEAITNNWADA